MGRPFGERPHKTRVGKFIVKRGKSIHYFTVASIGGIYFEFLYHRVGYRLIHSGSSNSVGRKAECPPSPSAVCVCVYVCVTECLQKCA